MKRGISQPRHKVMIIKNVMIPMRDGVHLAADLLMPEEKGKFPGIIQYHPYRKDDVSQANNDAHYYFAQRGYVGIRLDVRGTGSSEGYTKDEYSVQEIEDGQDAINWLADQEWCTGELGMFGYSYSGTTTMNQASYAPKPLKAVAPAYFSDDRYRADSHYIGGSHIPIIDCGFYAPFMTCYNAAPPYPEYSGKRWMELWKERLEKSTPWAMNWLEHSLDGDYWRPGSVRYRYDNVKAATFLIAGWRDAYPGAEIRVYEGIKSPKRLLIGPWLHTSPHNGPPGPLLHIEHEMLRWWDYWLKDIDTGVMTEAPVSMYVQKFDNPKGAIRETSSGFWRYEKEWPIRRTQEKSLYFDSMGRLSDSPETPKGGGAKDTFAYAPQVGVFGGIQSQGTPYVLPVDQRFEEGFSVNYTSAPFRHDMEVTGVTKAEIFVSSTAKVASFVVRLSDLSEDGTSALVCKGVLNATRRNSMEKPEELTPGKIYRLEIGLEATSWLFEKGHRIRVSISSSDWPNMWPTPYNAVNSVYRDSTHRSRLVLPVVPPSRAASAPEYPPPAPLFQPADIAAGRDGYQIVHDLYEKKVLVRAEGRKDLVLRLKEIGAEVTASREFEAGVSTENPALAHVKGFTHMRIKRRDSTFDIYGTNILTSTQDDMNFTAIVDVKVDGLPFFSKNWTRVYERKLT